MPVRKTDIAQGGLSYGTFNLFIGEVHLDSVRIDASTLTGDIDPDGYLIPGLPLAKDGTSISDDGAGNSDGVYGVVAEPVETGTSGTYDVAVATIGQVNQALAEENLGRAYTAGEVVGFEGGAGTGAAKCLLTLAS